MGNNNSNSSNWRNEDDSVINISFKRGDKFLDIVKIVETEGEVFGMSWKSSDYSSRVNTFGSLREKDCFSISYFEISQKYKITDPYMVEQAKIWLDNLNVVEANIFLRLGAILSLVILIVLLFDTRTLPIAAGYIFIVLIINILVFRKSIKVLKRKNAAKKAKAHWLSM